VKLNITILTIALVMGLGLGCQQPSLPLARDLALDSDEQWCAENLLSVPEKRGSDEGVTSDTQLSRYVLLLYGGYWDLQRHRQIRSHYSAIIQVVEVYKTQQFAKERLASLDWSAVRGTFDPQNATPIPFPTVGEQWKAWANPLEGSPMGSSHYVIVFRKGRVIVELSVSMDLDYLQDTVMQQRPWIKGLPGEILGAMEEIALPKVIEVAQKAEARIPYPN
jgi:hypothetical protein